jgi:hypothetical protein
LSEEVDSFKEVLMQISIVDIMSEIGERFNFYVSLCVMYGYPEDVE